MKRRLLAVLLSCVLLAGLGAEAHADRAKKPFVFTTVTLEGKDISSEELFRDHAVTLIHVWATWCEPCIEELEELSKLHTRLQTCGCGIVGILWDGDTAQEEGRVIAEEKKLSFPILLPCEEMGALTEITVFPTTFFVDPEGRPVAEPISGAKTEQYEQTVRTLLKQKAAGTGILAANAGDAGDGNGLMRPVKTNGEAAVPRVPEGMILVCDGDACTLVPAEEAGSAENQPIVSDKGAVEDPETDAVADDAAEPAQNPRPDTEGEGEPATTEDYPSCPIVPVYVSETEVRIRAAGEYAGADGKDPPVP